MVKHKMISKMKIKIIKNKELSGKNRIKEEFQLQMRF